MTQTETMPKKTKRKSLPPINTSKSNVLQGCTEFKVITLGIQGIVQAGRDSGTGFNRLAKEINEGVLAESKVKISGMAIKRWCDEYYNEESKESTDHAVNLYAHYIEMLNQISKQMDIQSVCIDELSKESEASVDDIVNLSKALNAAMITYEKLSSRKVVIMGTIGDIQEKVYGYIASQEAMETVLGIVKARDAAMYDDIKDELGNNEKFKELLRKIMPAK